jgi:hypothetical protein
MPRKGSCLAVNTIVLERAELGRLVYRLVMQFCDIHAQAGVGESKAWGNL